MTKNSCNHIVGYCIDPRGGTVYITHTSALDCEYIIKYQFPFCPLCGASICGLYYGYDTIPL